MMVTTDGDSHMDALKGSNFAPSGGRSLAKTSDTMATGLEPTRKALPQLLPDGLPPHLHLVTGATECRLKKNDLLHGSREHVGVGQRDSGEGNGAVSMLQTFLDPLVECVREGGEGWDRGEKSSKREKTYDLYREERCTYKLHINCTWEANQAGWLIPFHMILKHFS